MMLDVVCHAQEHTHSVNTLIKFVTLKWFDQRAQNQLLSLRMDNKKKQWQKSISEVILVKEF